MHGGMSHSLAGLQLLPQDSIICLTSVSCTRLIESATSTPAQEEAAGLFFICLSVHLYMCT